MFFLTTVIRPPYSLTSSNCIEAIFIHFVLETHLTLPEFPLTALPSELAAWLLPCYVLCGAWGLTRVHSMLQSCIEGY